MPIRGRAALPGRCNGLAWRKAIVSACSPGTATATSSSTTAFRAWVRSFTRSIRGSSWSSSRTSSTMPKIDWFSSICPSQRWPKNWHRCAKASRPGLRSPIVTTCRPMPRFPHSCATTICLPPKTMTTIGHCSTRTPPRAFAIRRARPAIRRASCSVIARPFCTPSERACRTQKAIRRKASCCRSCRCFTSMRGAFPIRPRWWARSWSFRAARSTARISTRCSSASTSRRPQGCRPCGSA